MRNLRLTSDALDDLVEISEYLDSVAENTQASLSVVTEIYRRLDYLRESPMMNSSREELGPGYRSVVASRYIIYYRFTDTEIIVLHVAHGARSIESIFN